MVPASPIIGWGSLNFDSKEWNQGSFGVGYDTSEDYEPFFQTDVKDSMRGIQTSIYMRSEFQIDEPNSILKIGLKMRYEDGFVVWINDQQVASRNAPASVDWDSRATSNRPDSQAVQNTNIDLQFNLENLNKGNNVLAIQGLNRSEIGADFLISPELTITKAPDQADLNTGYFLNPTPGLSIMKVYWDLLKILDSQ